MPELAKIAGFYTDFGKHFRFSLSRTPAATPMLTNSASFASHIVGATMGPIFTHTGRIWPHTGHSTRTDTTRAKIGQNPRLGARPQ